MDKKLYAEKKQAEMRQQLKELAERLTSSEDVAGYLNKKMYVLNDDSIPCAKWSPMNLFWVMLAGTCDARGYDQWKQAGRQVKQGAKTVHILVPCFRKEENDGQEKDVLRYFRSVPVFRAEDTEGEPLPYEAKLAALNEKVPELPLIDVAKKLGLSVSFGFSPGHYFGYFSPHEQKIMLCTDSEQTFFHELAHAIDYKLENLEAGKHNLNEIVAEFTACFLASQYGKSANLLYTREYLKNNGKLSDVFKALERASQIVEYIATASHKKRQAA